MEAGIPAGKLLVEIISPKETIFRDFALSVSSTNSVGNFDIFPEHANFITIIKNSPLIVRKTEKEQLTFNFPLAIIYVTRNRVTVYTEVLSHLI